MKKLTFTDEHRRRHFDFFRRMAQPHFNICANVDISALLSWLRKEELPFTPAIVYCISRTANEIPEFRQRIRGEQAVEHEAVHPSFTVMTEASDVFSFCTVHYQPGFRPFLQRSLQQMEAMQEKPSMEDEEGRDDFLFLSAIPWISFTGLQHAMHSPAIDSVPRIAWGRYFREGEKIKMPLSVQAHHALVDGRHMGAYFEEIQSFLHHPEKILQS